MMTNYRPVYWHEGLFIRPQHFQRQDKYQQSYAYNLSTFNNPFLWGMLGFDVSEAALNNQVFELKACEIVFQDGTYISCPGNAVLKNRSFADFWGKSGETMSVYLGLMKVIPGKNNLRQSDDRSARYVLSEQNEEVYDLFDNGKKEDLVSIDYEIHLFFGDEVNNLVDFNILKLAEISNNGNEIVLLDSYIPPVINVNASATLERICRELTEKLTSRCRELALYKNDTRISNVSVGGRDLIYLMTLQSLSKYVALLHHVFSSNATSPWDVYGLLRQIIAELATYSSSFNVFGVEDSDKATDKVNDYHHENLYVCFNEAALNIMSILDEITAGPDYSAVLFYDGTYFYSDLDDVIFKGYNKYFIKIAYEDDFEDQLDAIVSTLKISSKEYLPILIARSLSGLAIEYCASPPSQLSRGNNVAYYELIIEGDAWDPIKNMSNIAVYVESGNENLEFELVVIYGK